VEHAGSQFDPEIVQLFVEQVRREEAVRDAVPDAVAETMPRDVMGETDGIVAPLVASSTDGLTLLGNRRALEEAIALAARDAAPGARPALLLMELADLPDLNRRRSYEAGDRMIQLAARNVQRAAARAGGRAYRASGSRLAVLVALHDGEPPESLLAELHAEFTGGPPVRTALCMLQPGEGPSDVLGRARKSLEELA
jgi:GGDEF domain-containing protein